MAAFLLILAMCEQDKMEDITYLGSQFLMTLQTKLCKTLQKLRITSIFPSRAGLGLFRHFLLSVFSGGAGVVTEENKRNFSNVLSHNQKSEGWNI